MKRTLAAILTVVASLLARAAQAQCPAGAIPVNEVLDELRASAQRTVELAALEPNPRAAKQVQASSTVNSSVSPVDAPSLGGLLALALDSGLAQVTDESAVTVSLTPFTFVAASDPSVLDDQAEYMKYTFLRRVEGALTLGGKGESFDRDGDGESDPAETAKDLGDQIGWEARYRLIGSRDRREGSYRKKAANAVLKALVADIDGYASLVNMVQIPQAGYDAKTACFDRALLRAHLATPEMAEHLAGIRLTTTSVKERVDELLRDVDRSLVVTMFASGVHRKDELGPDRQTYGLRAAVGFGPLDHTLNVDWMREEAPPSGKRPETLKVGYAAKGELKIPGFETPLLSLLGALEHTNNVPNVKHATIAKFGAKLDLGLGRGVRMPVSITWANHADLLTDEDDVIGHIGISLDLLDKTKPKKP